MSFGRILAGAAIAMAGFVGADSANATVINFSGATVDMGTLVVGQTGTITDPVPGSSVGPYSYQSLYDYGFLSSDAKVNFTYNYSDLVGGSIAEFASYSYSVGGDTYAGNASGVSPGSNSASGTVNGVGSAPLVFASANLTATPTTGTGVITNVSARSSAFQSAFNGLFSGTGRLVSITYSVSAVPLPATLPMFGAALIGLAGFAFYRNRRAV